MTTRETTYVYKQEGLESVQRQLAQTGAASDATAAKLGRGARDASTGMKVLDATVGELRAQGDRLSASLGPLDGIMRSLGPAGALMAGGIGAGVAILAKAVGEAAQAERAMVKIEAVLKATGNASGLTAGKIDDMTKALSRATMATEEEAKGAATQLLSFRTIAGDTFAEVLTLSQDLAASGFGGLAENAVKLGKALENPGEGLDGLARLGLVVADQQKELAKRLAETGDAAGAQNVILTALRDRVGGAGAAEGNTLVGAWHGLGEATGEWFETVGQNSGLVSRLTDWMNGLATAIDKVAHAWTIEGQLEDRLAKQATGYRSRDAIYRQKLDSEIVALRAAIDAKKKLAAAEETLAKRRGEAAQAEINQDRVRAKAAKDAEESAKAAAKNAKQELADRWAFFQDMQRVNAELETLSDKRKEREEKNLKEIAQAEHDAYYDRLERQREEEKEQADILKERQREFTDYYNSAVSVLQESLLDPTAEGWDDTLKGMFSKFKRWIASLAIEAAARPVLVPILAQLFGNGVTGAANAAGVGGGGGASGLVSNGLSVANLLKGGSLTSSVFGGFATSGLGTSLGLSTAPVAMGAEGLAATFGTYATTAPTLTGLGSAFSFMTSPTGIGLAVAAGLVLSKLLKGKPSDKAEYTDLNLLTGARFEDDLGPKKDDPENRAAVNAMADAIVSLKSLLQDKTGGIVGLGRVVLSVGDRGTPYRANVDGTERGFQTEQEAIAYVTQELVKSLTGVPERVQRAVDGMDWSNVDAAFADLDKVLSFEQAIKDFTQQVDEKSPIQQVFENISKNFVTLGEEMKKFGYTQEELADLQNQAIQKARALVLKDRTAEFYGETGRGYLNALGGLVTADKTRRADDLAAGLDPAMSAAIFAAQLAKTLTDALGEASDYASAVGVIADIKAQFSTYPDILAAADTALGRFGKTVATVPVPVPESIKPLRDVTSLIVGLYDEQLDALDKQAAALKDSSDGWSRLSDTIRRTRQSFGLDSTLSPYSLERRLQESMSLYRSTQARANAGDLKAGEELPDIARTALELAREFYRSSSDYTTFFDEVQAGLRSTESFASRQLTVEQLQLSALEAIRAALVGQRDGVKTPSAATGGVNAADWANLGNSYEAAKQRFLDNGGSLQGWLNSSTHQNVWERARDDLISGTTDSNYLLSSLAEARRQKDNPLYASTGSSWEGALQARLQALGIPQFARGGMVENTGLAYVHAGERVLTSQQQDGIAAEVRALSSQVEGLTRLMAEAQTRLIDATRDVAATNRAMADDARYAGVQMAARGRVA